jgi:hypothetical protein
MTKVINTYLVHMHVLVSPYQINTDESTHILLNHLFINAIRHSNMFQSLEDRLQRVYFISFRVETGWS